MNKEETVIEISKIVDKAYNLGVKETLKRVLPTDKECAEWHDLNIDDNDASVSSSIYKFRLWLQERAGK